MKKIIIGIVILFLIMGVSFQCLSAKSIPVMKEIAKKEMERFCQLIVNHASFPYSNIDQKLVIIERDDNHQVSVIAFDMPYITKIAGEIVLTIEELLLSLEEGIYKSKNKSIYHNKLQKISDNKGVITTIPLGLLTKNPFLANTGPKLKIKYKSISQVASSIDKEVKNYGINRMLIGLNIVITIRLQVITPFYQEEFTQEISFPLCLEIIEGQVPQWYQN